MIRFYSKAGADVLMLEAHAGRVLSALGRDLATQGIFLPDQIPAAIVSCERASEKPDLQPLADEGAEDLPDLARRAWPVLQLLRRALEADQPVLWIRV